MPQNSLEAANASPRCQHTRFNGARCGAPALAGGSLCRLHQHALRPKRPDYRLPFVEDAASAQLALNLILRALQDKAWDLKTCALMLYDLQIACSNLKRLGEDMPPQSAAPRPSLAALLMNTSHQMAAENAAEPQSPETPEDEPEWWEKKPPSSAPKG
jgi:hypothetical protein